MARRLLRSCWPCCWPARHPFGRRNRNRRTGATRAFRKTGELGVGEAARRAAPAFTVRSEQDYFRNLIPAHAAVADASILIFADTEDETLRHIAERMYKAAYGENELIKLYYADTFRRMPTAAAPAGLIRDLNRVSGRERDRQYAEDMIDAQPAGGRHVAAGAGDGAGGNAHEAVGPGHGARAPPFVEDLQEWLERNGG